MFGNWRETGINNVTSIYYFIEAMPKIYFYRFFFLFLCYINFLKNQRIHENSWNSRKITAILEKSKIPEIFLRTTENFGYSYYSWYETSKT
jgi:hypothetical protein